MLRPEFKFAVGLDLSNRPASRAWIIAPPSRILTHKEDVSAGVSPSTAVPVVALASLSWDAPVRRRFIPQGDIERRSVGDELLVADHVRNRSQYVSRSDINFLGDLDRVVDLDAEMTNGVFDLRMPE